MMHRIKHSKSLLESGGGGGILMMIKNVGGGGFSSTPPMGSSSSSSRRFFNTGGGGGGGGGGGITTSSSSLMKRDMFQRAAAGNIPNLFRGGQSGGCVGSSVPHQCNKSHMLPYFARSLASSSASQSSGQTPRQEPEKKKKKEEEGQIIRSSELQRERCDEISSTEVSLNQFPGLMVHGIVRNSKTRRLLRLNPDTGYFEEQDVAAGHYDLQVPNGHVCRGSAYGWLFLTDDNLDMKLLNPFSGAEIQLPPVKTLPPSEKKGWELSQWFVSKAVFSANPSIEPRPVVLVIYGGQHMPRLAFCKPGDKGWTPLEFPTSSFLLDAIYHKGQFYVLAYRGYVAAFDIGRRIDDDDHSVKTDLVATAPPPNKRIYMRDWYFVVLDGELVRFELRAECDRDCCIHHNREILEFMRNRDGDTTDDDYYGTTDEESEDGDDTTDEEDYTDEESEDGDDTTDEEDYTDEESEDGDDTTDEESEDDYRKKENMYLDIAGGIPRCIQLRLPWYTSSIKIRRFDVSEKQWVKVDSLGDKAVFLGYNTSFALSASDYPAGLCIPDSVYFTYGGGGDQNTERPSYDMGIYNVKDKTVKPLCPPMDDEYDASSQFIKKPAPIWIVNSADK